MYVSLVIHEVLTKLYSSVLVDLSSRPKREPYLQELPLKGTVRANKDKLLSPLLCAFFQTSSRSHYNLTLPAICAVSGPVVRLSTSAIFLGIKTRTQEWLFEHEVIRKNVIAPSMCCKCYQEARAAAAGRGDIKT